jgi:hypothetical protein
MKLKIFTFFLTIISLPIFGQEIEQKVQIIGIDSTQSYYFIKGNLENSNDKILIISKKDTTAVCCIKIKPNNTYLLKLLNYISDERLKEWPALPPGTFQVREEGYTIWVNSENNRMPYKSIDIKSIYYIRENNPH